MLFLLTKAEAKIPTSKMLSAMSLNITIILKCNIFVAPSCKQFLQLAFPVFQTANRKSWLNYETKTFSDWEKICYKNMNSFWWLFFSFLFISLFFKYLFILFTMSHILSIPFLQLFAWLFVKFVLIPIHKGMNLFLPICFVMRYIDSISDHLHAITV